MKIVPPQDRLMHFMCKDVVVCDVWYNFATNTVRFKNYSSDWIALPFGTRPDTQTLTIADLDFALESYTFPETQAGCKERLKYWGLDFYDRFELVRRTHGVMTNSHTWIKFDDDSPELCWAQVNPFPWLRPDQL